MVGAKGKGVGEPSYACGRNSNVGISGREQKARMALATSAVC